MRVARLLLSLAAASLPLAPAVALAHGGGGAVPAEVPLAPPGDGSTAQGLLKELDAEAAADPEVSRVTVDAVKASKLALEHAHGARAAGDVDHARMLDGVALEWAETARDLRKAVAAERAARAVSQKAHDAKTKAERARALLEETQARRGRTAAEIARVEAEAKDTAKGAEDTEAKRVEAAKRKGAPRKVAK